MKKVLGLSGKSLEAVSTRRQKFCIETIPVVYSTVEILATPDGVDVLSV